MTVYICTRWSKYYDSPEGSWENVKVVSTEEAAQHWVGDDKDRSYDEFEVDSDE